jgi:hypothetical protein
VIFLEGDDLLFERLIEGLERRLVDLGMFRIVGHVLEIEPVSDLLDQDSAGAARKMSHSLPFQWRASTIGNRALGGLLNREFTPSIDGHRVGFPEGRYD